MFPFFRNVYGGLLDFQDGHHVNTYFIGPT
jgi:hypothetical protein